MAAIANRHTLPLPFHTTEMTLILAEDHKVYGKQNLLVSFILHSASARTKFDLVLDHFKVSICKVL